MCWVRQEKGVRDGGMKKTTRNARPLLTETNPINKEGTNERGRSKHMRKESESIPLSLKRVSYTTDQYPYL